MKAALLVAFHAASTPEQRFKICDKLGAHRVVFFLSLFTLRTKAGRPVFGGVGIGWSLVIIPRTLKLNHAARSFGWSEPVLDGCSLWLVRFVDAVPKDLPEPADDIRAPRYAAGLRPQNVDRRHLPAIVPLLG